MVNQQLRVCAPFAGQRCSELGRVKADIAVSGLVERLLKKPGHSAKLIAALPR